MKIIAYAVRPDEYQAFEDYSKRYNIQIDQCKEPFSVNNADLAKGYDSIIIIGNCKATREALQKIKEYGITYMTTRSTGFNNIDLDAAREFGLKIANVPAYSPNSVGDFTILLILSLLRKFNTIQDQTRVQNYSLPGLIGKEIRNQVIGIIGTGKIGSRVIESLQGMNPKKVLAYDPYINPSVEKYAEYVSLEKLLEESDVISVHIPLSDNTYHILGADNIPKMKDGVYLINTARGGLMDAEAIVQNLDNGKIAGLATDVYEYELGILHANREGTVIEDETFNKLQSHPNVIITPHCAFYTDEAVTNMVEYSILNLLEYQKKQSFTNEIV